jgi:hypothetical protein
MAKQICNSVGQIEHCPKCSCSIPHTKQQCKSFKKCDILEKECEEVIERNFMEDNLDMACDQCGAVSISECICGL